MEAKYINDLYDLEVESNKNSINFYTPNNNTLSKICFVYIQQIGLTTVSWEYEFATGIEVKTDTKLGFTTGTYCYIDNEKYVEIELLPGIIPKYYNNSAIGEKGRKRGINKFNNKKSRKGQTLLFDLPTTVFVREQDVDFITGSGIKYDRIDTTPIDKKVDLIITDTDNGYYNDGLGSEIKEEEENNKTLLLAAAVVLLKYLM